MPARHPKAGCRTPVVIDEVVPDMPARPVVVYPMLVGAHALYKKVPDVVNEVNITSCGVSCIDASPAVPAARLRDDVVDVVALDDYI